jgi:hypothetical protein
LHLRPGRKAPEACVVNDPESVPHFRVFDSRSQPGHYGTRVGAMHETRRPQALHFPVYERVVRRSGILLRVRVKKRNG